MRLFLANLYSIYSRLPQYLSSFLITFRINHKPSQRDNDAGTHLILSPLKNVHNNMSANTNLPF
jgi:hypothetical protein